MKNLLVAGLVYFSQLCFHPTVDQHKSFLVDNFQYDMKKSEMTCSDASGKVFHIFQSPPEVKDTIPDEQLKILDALNHEVVITTNVDSLFAKYGKEGALYLLSKHTLIELNNIREKEKLSVFTPNEFLMESAQNSADTAAEYNYFGHYFPKQNTRSKERILDAGFCCGSSAEIAGDGYSTISEAIQGWKESSTHAEAIQHPGFVYFGLGFAHKENNPEKRYVHFGAK